MPFFRILTLAALGLLLTHPLAAQSNAQLVEQVRTAETAFAETMAKRDLAAFSAFVAMDAVFIGRTALRGRDAVREGWKRFYDGADAPFSWKPETVEVLANGSLALSSGPPGSSPQSEGRGCGRMVTVYCIQLISFSMVSIIVDGYTRSLEPTRA